MSEIFEGVVVPAVGGRAPAPAGRPAPLELSIARLGPDAFVVYRSDARHAAAFTDRTEALAEGLSEVVGRALLVRYDSRIGHRSACVYEHGNRVRTFGEDDELFVPLDEEGEPILSADPVTRSEFEDGEEYETVRNAIEQGLDALGVAEWDSLLDLMTR